MKNTFAQTRSLPQNCRTLFPLQYSKATQIDSRTYKDSERLHVGLSTASTLYDEAPSIFSILYRVVDWWDVAALRYQRAFVVNSLREFFQSSRDKDSHAWFYVVPHRIAWSSRFKGKARTKQSPASISFLTDFRDGTDSFDLFNGAKLNSSGVLFARPNYKTDCVPTRIQASRMIEVGQFSGKLRSGQEAVIENRICYATEDYESLLRKGRVPAAVGHHEGSVAISVMLNMCYMQLDPKNILASIVRSMSLTFTRDGRLSSMRSALSSFSAVLATYPEAAGILLRMPLNH